MHHSSSSRYSTATTTSSRSVVDSVVASPPQQLPAQHPGAAGEGGGVSTTSDLFQSSSANSFPPPPPLTSPHTKQEGGGGVGAGRQALRSVHLQEMYACLSRCVELMRLCAVTSTQNHPQQQQQPTSPMYQKTANGTSGFIPSYAVSHNNNHNTHNSYQTNPFHATTFCTDKGGSPRNSSRGGSGAFAHVTPEAGPLCDLEGEEEAGTSMTTSSSLSSPTSLFGGTHYPSPPKQQEHQQVKQKQPPPPRDEGEFSINTQGTADILLSGVRGHQAGNHNDNASPHCHRDFDVIEPLATTTKVGEAAQREDGKAAQPFYSPKLEKLCELVSAAQAILLEELFFHEGTPPSVYHLPPHQPPPLQQHQKRSSVAFTPHTSSLTNAGAVAAATMTCGNVSGRPSSPALSSLAAAGRSPRRGDVNDDDLLRFVLLSATTSSTGRRSSGAGGAGGGGGYSTRSGRSPSTTSISLAPIVPSQTDDQHLYHHLQQQQNLLRVFPTRSNNNHSSNNDDLKSTAFSLKSRGGGGGGDGMDASSNNVALFPFLSVNYQLHTQNHSMAESLTDAQSMLQSFNPFTTKTLIKSTDEFTGNKTVNQYLILDDLGEGACGKVKLAYSLERNITVAIKIVRRGSGSGGGRSLGRNGGLKEEALRREVQLMKRLRHPNLVSLFEVIDDPNAKKMYLIMKFADNGSVGAIRGGGDHVCTSSSSAATSKVPFSSSLRALVDLTFQVSCGLQYLHDRGIYHRDLKPENILQTSDGQYMIGDFGISVTQKKGTYVSMYLGSEQPLGLGTPLFMAPELTAARLSHATRAPQQQQHATSNDGDDEDMDDDDDEEAESSPLERCSENEDRNKALLAADMWAFAVTIMSLGTGRWPFQSTDAIRCSPSEEIANAEIQFFEFVSSRGGCQSCRSSSCLTARHAWARVVCDMLKLEPGLRPNASVLRKATKLLLSKALCADCSSSAQVASDSAAEDALSSRNNDPFQQEEGECEQGQPQQQQTTSLALSDNPSQHGGLIGSIRLLGTTTAAVAALIQNSFTGVPIAPTATGNTHHPMTASSSNNSNSFGPLSSLRSEVAPPVTLLQLSGTNPAPPTTGSTQRLAGRQRLDESATGGGGGGGGGGFAQTSMATVAFDDIGGMTAQFTGDASSSHNHNHNPSATVVAESPAGGGSEQQPKSTDDADSHCLLLVSQKPLQPATIRSSSVTTIESNERMDSVHSDQYVCVMNGLSSPGDGGDGAQESLSGGMHDIVPPSSPSRKVSTSEGASVTTTSATASRHRSISDPSTGSLMPRMRSTTTMLTAHPPLVPRGGTVVTLDEGCSDGGGDPSSCHPDVDAASPTRSWLIQS